MTDNTADRVEVALEEATGTQALPGGFAVTVGWGRDYWLNEEDGVKSEPGPRPSVDDVVRAWTDE